MLSPYRVLDLTDERGIVCGQILADLGAEVIAVEPPGGSPARGIGPFVEGKPDPEHSLFWWAYARGKRSVTLDLHTEEGRARLRELALSADVLVESFAPGYMEGLGLGAHALREINQGLVYVAITPFGLDGPKAGWAATEITAWAASGTLALTGDDDRAPVRLPCEQGWLHAGAEAAVGTLVALSARANDGRGRLVDVSAQQAAMMATQASILGDWWSPESGGSRLAGGVKLGPLKIRFVHACKDGHASITFLFGSVIGPYTRRLFEWMYEEGFVDEATRDKDWVNYVGLLLTGQEPVEELDRCTDAIAAFVATKTKAELFEAAMTRALLIVPVATTEDLAQSPQLAARDYWTPVEQEPGVTALHPGPFARPSAYTISYRRAPRIGEWGPGDGGRGPGGEPAATSLAVGRAATGVRGQASGADPRLPAPDFRPPLTGVNVLDFTWVVVGPWGTRYLADHGATVVRVESATRADTARGLGPFKDQVPGPERSGLYATLNAGKLGLALNLGTAAGRATVGRLARWADVIVDNFAPGAMKRLGLDHESVSRVNPSVITLSTSLNGGSGPWASLAGFGTMGAQLAGFGAVVGWPDRIPAAPFGAYTDYVTPKYMASVLLAALDHRRRTGEGGHIDLSQAEASMHFLAPTLLDYTVNGRPGVRRGNADDRHAPHGVYPAGGGATDRWIALACATEEQWTALCRVAACGWDKDSRFNTREGRLVHREALDQAVAAWTATLGLDELEERLQAAGVPAHRVMVFGEWGDDAQLAHRGHFLTVAHPELGDVVIEGSRFHLEGFDVRPPWPGPVYGQHNEQVLRDVLGMSDDEVIELVASGALE